MSPLDRPIWHALTGPQREQSLGTDRARRYLPEIGPLAATVDESPESLADLGRIVAETGAVGVLRDGDLPPPPGCRTLHGETVVQMVADRVDPADAAFGEPLTAADAPDMLALAELTRPGPFAARTVELGHFFGIRHDGRLVAMVGERMRVAGWTEVSGVSTHPDVRGRHLAERLVRRIVGGIVARGERPFLHVLATNRPALGLYRRLGFTRRRDFVFQLFEPTPN